MALTINFNLIGNEDETFQLSERIHEALSGSRCYIDSEVCFNFGNHQDEVYYDRNNGYWLSGRKATLIIGENNKYDQTATGIFYKDSFIGPEEDDQWVYFGNLNDHTKIYIHRMISGLIKFTDNYGKTEYQYRNYDYTPTLRELREE